MISCKDRENDNKEPTTEPAENSNVPPAVPGDPGDIGSGGAPARRLHNNLHRKECETIMKKLIALTLAVMLMLSLFGCANGNDPVGTTDPSTETTLSDHEHGDETVTPTDGSEATTEPTTEPTEAPTAPTTEPTEAPTETTAPPPVSDNSPDDIGGGGVADNPGQTEHKHSYSSKTTKPTCESKGYTTYTCACGNSYTDNEKSATGHSYSSQTVAPTCNKDGYTKYTCSNCGDSYNEKNGTYATGEHNYVTTTVAPTETEDGYDRHVCSGCGSEYRDNYVNKTGKDEHHGTYYDFGTGKYVPHDCASQGHKWDDAETVKEATCTSPTTWKHTCRVYGCGYSEQYEAGQLASHTRSIDTITGHKTGWQVRSFSGYSPSFDNKDDMVSYVRSVVAKYKNGESTDCIEYIEEYVTPVYDPAYTCLSCGQSLNSNEGGGRSVKWNGDTGYYTVWRERYTADNQPNY